MKSYTEGKAAAEKGGTERREVSIPAFRWFIRGGGAVIIAIAATVIYQSYHDETKQMATEAQAKAAMQPAAVPAVPLASSDPSTWPQVTIAANGRSQDILLPIEMHHIVVMGTGGRFRLHSVYDDKDKRDCAFGDNCPDGNVRRYYIVDESGTANKVSYAFVPIGR